MVVAVVLAVGSIGSSSIGGNGGSSLGRSSRGSFDSSGSKE